MIRVSLFFYMFYLMAKSKGALLSENERNVAASLMKELQINHCLLVQDLVRPNVSYSKLLFLTWEIPVNYVSISRLFDSVVDLKFFNVRTLVIFKISNLKIVEDFLISLKEVKKLHFIRKYIWLIFVDSPPNLKESKLLVPYDCQFIIAFPYSGAGYKLLEIYNLKERNVIYDYGFWNLQYGLKATVLSVFQRRNDVNGTEFIFESDQPDIFICDTSRQCAHNEVLVDILKMANFKLLPKKTTEIKEEYKLEEGDAVNKMSYFHPAFFAYNCLAPLFRVEVNWYIKDPSDSKHADYYIRVFHVNLWMAIGATIMFGGLTFLILRIFYKYLLKEILTTTIVDDFLTVLDYFCDQDNAIYFKRSAFRLTTVAYRLAAMCIIPAYSATITAYLSVRVPQAPFKDLKSFVQNGEYTLGAVQIRYPYKYFQKSQEPLNQKIFKNFLVPINETEAIKRLCSEKFAFIYPNNDIYQLKADCRFFEIEKAITYVDTAVTLSVDTPFRNLLRHNLIYIYSSGVHSKINEQLKGEGLVEEASDFLPVELDQMAQVFSIVPLGVGLAIAVFVVELITTFIKKLLKYLSKRPRVDETLFRKSSQVIMSANFQLIRKTPPVTICSDVNIYEDFFLQKRKKSYCVALPEEYLIMEIL